MSEIVHQALEPHSKRGFVLFTVIWLVAAIAVMTTMFVTRAQNTKILQRALSFNRELEMAADGFVRLQVFRLTKQSLGLTQPTLDVRGGISTCGWSEKIQLSFAVQDQAGLVDINTASPATITTILQASGADAAKASLLSEAVFDYRDPDSVTKDGGSELALYPENGPTPSNLPFMAIEELDRIPGLSDNVFSKLLQITTVHSQQQGVDPATVPDELMRILSYPSNKLPGTLHAPSPKRVYAITVKAIRKGGGHFSRHAIVSVTGQPDRPFAILKWAKRGREFLNDTKPTDSLCFDIKKS